MKKYIPFLLTLLLLAGCAAPAAQEGTYRQITMDEAIIMMEEESNYIILDVRTPEEFSEKHIPGAINIPNETIGTEEVPELPDKDQLILIYCRAHASRQPSCAEKKRSMAGASCFQRSIPSSEQARTQAPSAAR